MLAVRCPRCQTVLQFPEEQAGEQVTCASCGARLALPRRKSEGPAASSPAVPSPPEPPVGPPPLEIQGIQERRPSAPAGYDDDYADERRERGRPLDRGYRDRDDDYDDERGYRRRRDDEDMAPGWKLVRVGLMMLFVSSVVLIVLVAVAAVAGLAMGTALGGNLFNPNPRPMNPDMMGAAMPIMALAGCGILIAAITGFVGLCMCIGVPRESGAKGHAIGTVVSIVVTILVVVVGAILMTVQMSRMMNQAVGGAPGGGDVFRRVMLFSMIMGIGTGLMSFVVQVFFALFLRAVALCFHRETLARLAIWLLVGFGVTTLASLALQVLQYATFDPGALAGGRLDMPLQLPQMLLLVLQIALWIVEVTLIFMVYRIITPRQRAYA